MPREIFQPALQAMAGKERAIYGPTSFQDYLKTNSLPQAGTAESISIDSLERLPYYVKDNHAMVLRLGEAMEGTGTQFALVKVQNRLDDFFLKDTDIFTDLDGSTYLPRASMRQLFAYDLLPVLSETSLVNLGLASGLIGYALGLSNNTQVGPPATGRTSYTFQFKAHSVLTQTLEHRNGQVDIDALFVETRNGKETLFIVEAKCRESDRSLAKHKLVYPILAVAPHIPKDMPIIAVYLKVAPGPEGWHFHVVECAFPDPRKEGSALDELAAKRHTHLILPMRQWDPTKTI